MDNEEKVLDTLNSLQINLEELKHIQLELLHEVSVIHKQTEAIFTNTDIKGGLYHPFLS